ncbi:trigger factor [Nocardioidaceae bacterium]|nr:trigger factor [Nocardioidaceae bacterium]
MKSAVETLTPTRAKLTIEVPFSELQPSLDKAYKDIAKQINVPGFRRGKVPPPVIDRQVGRGAVLDQAINDALPGVYMRALQENEVEPLGQPEIDISRLEDGELLEFTAELDIKPAVEVPDYSDMAVSVADVEVSDEDVDTQIQSLRERFASLTEVERAAADGDFVTIDLKATQDGEDVEGAEVTGTSYQVGRGGMLDGLDEALTGMSAGEEKTFTSELVGGDAKGQQVDVLVKVSAVKEQELPELDDDFAQEASEFGTVAELREDVSTRLQRGKRLEQAAEARDAVLEALLEKVDVPLPESLVAEELTARRQSVEQQLAYAGMTMEAYLDDEGQTIDEFEAELEARVRDAVAAQFVLDAVVKAEEIEVEEQELQQHLMQRAQQSGQNPNEFIQHMLQHNHIPEMVAEVLRGKALARIVESATVTDASGATVDLANLRPDGSIGDPEAEAAEAAESAEAAEAAEAPADTATAEPTPEADEKA